MKSLFSEMTSDTYKMLHHLYDNQITDEDEKKYLIITQNNISTVFDASSEDAHTTFKYFKAKNYIDPLKGSRNKYVLTEQALKFISEMDQVEQNLTEYAKLEVEKEKAKAQPEADPSKAEEDTPAM